MKYSFSEASSRLTKTLINSQYGFLYLTYLVNCIVFRNGVFWALAGMLWIKMFVKQDTVTDKNFSFIIWPLLSLDYFQRRLSSSLVGWRVWWGSSKGLVRVKWVVRMNISLQSGGNSFPLFLTFIPSICHLL